MWDDELDDVVLIGMQHAYIRRKRFEAKLLAYQLMKMFAGMFGTSSSRVPANKHNVVGLSSFMDRMGAKWQ